MNHRKYIYMLILLNLVVCGLSSCRQTSSHPSQSTVHSVGICFQDTIHHFESISLQQPIDSFDFVFTNTGEGRLVVLGVETSCHCTRVNYPHEPVESGKQSYIRVFYDGTGRQPEYFNKSVKVSTNARYEPYILRISGNLK